MHHYIEQFGKDHCLCYKAVTIRDYLRINRRFNQHIQKPLDKIDRKDVRSFLIMLSESGLKPGTVATNLTAIYAFFNYCLEEGWITNNPVVGIPFPKVDEKLPRYLTYPELASLRACVEGNLFEQAMVEVFYTTGVRISELVRLRTEDLNWSERSILIQDGKGGVDRIVLFSATCGQYLETYVSSRADSSPHVFINPNTKRSFGISTINARFQSYSDSIGFRVTPHMLRYTFAAHLAQKEMSLDHIRQLLGHVNPRTTRHYATLYDHAQKKMYDKWM
ncbi:tyrosine-type recombinase/integrase [Sporosarcina sp. FSL K6-1508]|uniref:tyrosine-type recombinase/integrase n=1 Tax=Sporosarcina sp. FSL K6-1508 TaxID=2921553 RepID=UPI0030F9F7C9